MTEQLLTRVEFVSLKGLKDLIVDFGAKRVVGIFGVNGCGKSTILQALACLYKPIGKGMHDYRFTEFFKRINSAKWQGSKLIATMKTGGVERSLAYEKISDRWTPRKDKQPQRDVVYIGIKSCVPEIENIVSYVTSFDISHAVPTQLKDVDKILKAATEILGYDYSEFAENRCANHLLKRVKQGSGLEYTSLSMGAGEQRLFSLLKELYAVPVGGLLLIDEIDLTLHTKALNKLLDLIVEIADKRKLQVVFTSHREELVRREDIAIRHIWKCTGGTMYCINGTDSDAVFRLTGTPSRRMRIFVEDDLAAAVVRKVMKDEGMRNDVEVIEFGPIENSFVVVAGLELSGQDIEEMIFVLDGDRYRTRDERLVQMKRVYSGNEEQRAERRERAVSQMRQLVLPPDMSPERYLVQELKGCEGDIADMAREIDTSIGENHEPLRQIYARVGEDPRVINAEMVELLSHRPFWATYTSEIREWIWGKKKSLGINRQTDR